MKKILDHPPSSPIGYQYKKGFGQRGMELFEEALQKWEQALDIRHQTPNPVHLIRHEQPRSARNRSHDFLPFVCDSCSGVFCLEHRSREAHSCPEVSVKREVSGAGVSTTYPCTFQDCKGKELLPVICQHCQKHFCLAHRHQDDHKCEKLETPKPRMVATQELVQKIVESKKNALPSKGRKGAKNSATAAKVALMKLKLHAAGDKGLPQTERTYLQVFLPKEANVSSQPMFFSSKWSVGKVVDFAAAQASLKNNNNVLTAKKLRLCHPETGEALKMDASLQALLSLLESPLYNGGNVILEYLENDSFGVEDVTVYISSC